MLIGFANQKGGCAKTTCCWGTASVLRAQGKSVLMVDLDPQCSLSMLLNADDSRTIGDVLKGKYAITDVVQTIDKNGDMIAGSAELSLLSASEINRLKDVLTEIDKYYDFVIVDSTPSMSAISMSILNTINKLIIPATASLPVILAITQFGNMIRLAKENNPTLEVSGILLVMFDKRAIVSRSMRETAENVAKNLGTRLFNTTIRKGVVVDEAFASFAGLLEYAPTSNVALDYIDFVKELGV